MSDPVTTHVVPATDRSATPWRLPRTVLLVLLALASVYFVWRGPQRTLRRSKDADFQCFYSAARAWMHGTNPYDMHNLQSILADAGADVRVLPSLNPPVTFPLLTPFVLTDWPHALAIWTWFQVVFMAAILVLLVRVAGWPLTDRTCLWFLILALVLAPTHTSVSLGQIGVLTTLFVVMGLSAAVKGHDYLEGAALVLATALKPQMGAFFLLFALCGFRRRTWVSAVLVGLSLWAISLGQMWFHHVDWISSLQENYRNCFVPGGMNDPAETHYYTLLNLQYPLSLLVGSSAIAGLLAMGLTGAMGVFALWAQGKNPDRRAKVLTYAIVAVLTLLAVYNRYFNGVLLVFPLLWAFMSLRTADRRLAIGALILLAPFLFISTASYLRVLVEKENVPLVISSTWWWRMLIEPHQIYALLLLAVWLLFAAWRNRQAKAAPNGDGPTAALIQNH